MTRHRCFLFIVLLFIFLLPTASFARWYDPYVGRFISRDPIPKIGGENYSAVGDNPVQWPDPSGQCFGCMITDWVPPGHETTTEWPLATKDCCVSVDLYHIIFRISRNLEIQAALCDRSPKNPGNPEVTPTKPNKIGMPIMGTTCTWKYRFRPKWLNEIIPTTLIDLTVWNDLPGCIQKCMLAGEGSVREFCRVFGPEYFADHIEEGECRNLKAEESCLKGLLLE